ncbi:MAG: bifunctional phosphoribosylaminoimidazolecarboxamide formyltransferase/IMP cyclohydrolase [Bacteroidota bacterium]
MALKPLSKLPETPLHPKRALLSVSDKTKLVPLAKTLHAQGVELFSTGGTAQVIKDAEIPVQDVSELTGFPECLDGRVKTLHPKVHGGILARTSHQPDVKEIAELDIQAIDLVVANLYPFQEAIADPGCTVAKATEYIDIGGPTMVRASAKNFAHVSILTHPSQYDDFIHELNAGEGISFETRRSLAQAAFNHTAEYDAHIANYFNGLCETDNPAQLNVSLPKNHDLRYGENPHQQAAVYGYQDEYIDCFHGKQLSYNNYLDIDGALRLMAEFIDDDPTCAIFKHTIPCGVAQADSLTEAYRRAFATDTVSPFGGIVIVNQELDDATAEAIDEIFTEIIIAPSFSKEALNRLAQKKNRRLIRLKQPLNQLNDRGYQSIFGGALSQMANDVTIIEDDLQVVTERQPSEQQMNDLRFAWKVVKHVKSNAIVYAKNRQTLGIGSGQTSRVEASQIAIAKANSEGLSLDNCAIASDAFFPFADGVEAAAEAGATSVIQPGGSIRDDEVIEAANKADLAMVCTGMRHFRH